MGDVPYTLDGCIARMRVAESRGIEESAQRIKAAIAHAAQAGIGKMLVDIRELSVGPPTVAQRHWVMTEWASVGRGAVRLAVLIRPEFADPDSFGTAVALSRGMELRGFTEEPEALTWLEHH